jgi:hypothetical protein
MLPLPDRTPEELNAALERRMEDLVSSLMVINGMTKRGAVMPTMYRERELPAIRRFAERIFAALEKGIPAGQPWDKESADAA